MADIRWTWADASFVRRWSSAKLARDAINQLERLGLRDQRRPMQMNFRGKRFTFSNVKQAVTFLRPHADRERVTTMKQRQPWEDIDSLLGDTLPQADKARVRGALHCPAGHPIQRKGDGSSRWFLEKRGCHACGTTIGQHTTCWHCTSNCNYNVCHHCFQSAVWSATKIFAEKASESHHPSEASTCEGTPSVESVVEGPRVELHVEVGDRKEIWTFDTRALDVQLLELVECLGLPLKHGTSGSSSTYVLVRTCGSELEVIHSEAQLQPLVPLTSVSVERADILVGTYLEHLAKTPAAHALTPLRHLIAIVSTSEDLASEVFRQGGFAILRDVLRSSCNCNVAELACAGICALWKLAERRQEAMSLLRDNWPEIGGPVMSSLLTSLFDNRVEETLDFNQMSVLSFLLWILEDISSAASTAHAVAQAHEENCNSLYACIVAAAQSQSQELKAHAGRVVLCMMLRASNFQVANPDLPEEIRREISTYSDDSSHGIGWLEESVTEHGSTELLSILTSSCADAAASKELLLQQEVEQLRDEKKFNGMLQGKLRQNHKAMCEMADFVRVGDDKIEETIKAVVRDGWDSIDWPAGYTLLHFLCEYTYDTGLLKLVGELCTDLEARDDKGNRPIDYALKNPHPHVAQCMVEMSQDRVAMGLRSVHLGLKDRCEDSESICHKEVTSELKACPPCPYLQHSEQAHPKQYFLDSIGKQANRDEAASKAAMDVVVECDPESQAVNLQDPSMVHGERPEKLDASPNSDASNLGTVFMLRTQLATMTRENEALREKTGELEMLRTRLAIMSEEKGNVDETDCQRPMTSTLRQLENWKEAARARTSSSDTVEDAIAKEDQENCATSASKGKGKGKCKGKGKGEGKSNAQGEPKEEVNDKQGDSASQENANEPPDSSEMPKGKGKGKGKQGAAPPCGMPKGGKPEKGKGKGSQIEPTKPTLAPTQDLKTLPWTRFVVGSQIQEGTTIWDDVNARYDVNMLPVEEIEQRFGKTVGSQQIDKMSQRKAKKTKTVKLDSISQDQRFQVEVSLKTLPVSLNTGHKAACAIVELNRAMLPVEAVNTLHRFLCPKPEQVEELAAKRQLGEKEYERQLQELTDSDEQPDPFRWDPVEEYMETLSFVPACSMRLSCLSFISSIPDRLLPLEDNLDRFEKMVHCFHNSKELPSLLAIVLAFGNYLNGGKNEKRLGQADGFHIELLGRPGGLDVVNDPRGKNVKELIFKTFFERCPDKAAKLLSELAPFFSLVQRKLGKDADGVAQINKSVRVQIEDLDTQLVAMKRDMNAKHQELKEALKLIADPADKFVIEIPAEFEHERRHIDELSARKDLVLQQFKVLLASFKAETYRGDAVIVDGQMKEGNSKAEMTSEVWCNLWDDFFLPKAAMLSFDEKKQKELIEPRFCKEENAISVESLEILWRLRSDKPPAPRPRRESNAAALIKKAAAPLRKRNSV